MRTIRKVVAGLILSAFAGQSLAQSLDASETTAQINAQNHSTTIVFTPLAPSGMTATNSFNLELNYNPALLTFDSATTDNADIGCSLNVAGQVLCFADAGSTGLNLDPIPTSTITIVFDVGATTGTAVLDINNVIMTSTTGASQSPTVDDGEVVINLGPQPEFTGAPDNTNPLVINGAIGAPGSSPINVTNTGDVGSTLQVTAVAADMSATGTLTVAPTTQQNIAQGAAAVPFTVTCASTAAETFAGTVTFTTNDPDDGEGTVIYNVSCVIAAAPSAEFDGAPAAPGPIAIQDAVGGGGTTAQITVTNQGNLAMTVTPSGLTGVLAVSPTGQSTVAINGGTQVYTITCTATDSSTSNQVLTFTTNDPDDMEGTVTYNVSCQGIAPEYDSVPPVPGPIAITDPAGDMMGTSATLTVSNTGTGTLTLGAPTGLSGILSITPNSAQSIAAMGAPIVYTITCNATDAIDASQSLTITSNDASEPSNVYTVTCNATGAEITAPAGGSVSGFPGNTAPGSIAVTNAGDVALTVSMCTLGGTNPMSFTGPAATLTVQPGTTGALGFSCVVPAAGTTVTATLTCATNDASEPSVVFALSCTGINPSIPTLNDYGKLLLVAMVLGLGLLGFALRRS